MLDCLILLMKVEMNTKNHSGAKLFSTTMYNCQEETNLFNAILQTNGILLNNDDSKRVDLRRGSASAIDISIVSPDLALLIQ